MLLVDVVEAFLIETEPSHRLITIVNVWTLDVELAPGSEGLYLV